MRSDLEFSIKYVNLDSEDRSIDPSPKCMAAENSNKLK